MWENKNKTDLHTQVKCGLLVIAGKLRRPLFLHWFDAAVINRGITVTTIHRITRQLTHMFQEQPPDA